MELKKAFIVLIESINDLNSARHLNTCAAKHSGRKTGGARLIDPVQT